MFSNINQYPDQHLVPRQNRSDTVIPATTSGTAEYPPGALAAHIKRLNYNEARYRNDETARSGATLNQIINELVENIESALMQVVGVPP
ncbi:hypothetical protein N7455_004901 [Penicillium solitum]|uniref:uncharacterized protein n=1 Tax=Penicillium solitum TaxID=60172 RepID=UPI0017EA7A45|nr:hypothetical protein HAV15_004098 [Penicillium sp. str. \